MQRVYMTSGAATPSSQHAGLVPCVWVVDDDLGVLDAVTRVLRSVGYSARKFTSGELLLAQRYRASADCIVLDLCMPGMTGLEVQDALVRACNTAPVIFMSAHADVPSSVRAMKAGALDIPDPERAASMFFCLLKGEPFARLSYACCAHVQEADVEAHIDAVVDLFLRAYGSDAVR